MSLELNMLCTSRNQTCKIWRVPYNLPEITWLILPCYGHYQHVNIKVT